MLIFGTFSKLYVNRAMNHGLKRENLYRDDINFMVTFKWWWQTNSCRPSPKRPKCLLICSSLHVWNSFRSASKTPWTIRKSQKSLLKQFRELKQYKSKNITDIKAMKHEYAKSRDKHRKLVRAFKANDSIIRDQKLYSILSSDPSKLFSSIRRSKRSRAGKICKLWGLC